MFLDIICRYHKYPLTNRHSVGVKLSLFLFWPSMRVNVKIEDRTEIHEMAGRKMNNVEIPGQH